MRTLEPRRARASLPLAALGGALLLGACATDRGQLPASSHVTVEKQADRLVVRVGDQPFTEYRFQGVLHPSLYPLIGPGGVAVSRGFPIEDLPGELRDHVHHTSLWFAHGDVDHCDFWTGSDGARIEHERFTDVYSGEAGAVVRSKNRWVSGEGKLVCTEQRTMRFLASPLDSPPGTAWRMILFEIVLRPADGTLVFGDTKEGTFALRVAPWLRLDGPAAAGHILDSVGRRDGACWGKRSEWVDYTGTKDGKVLGVAIIDGPQNPRHPTWWHARPYGLLAANPFGVHDFEGAAPDTGVLRVLPGEELHFNYIVYLHEGQPDPQKLDSLLELARPY